MTKAKQLLFMTVGKNLLNPVDIYSGYFNTTSGYILIAGSGALVAIIPASAGNIYTLSITGMTINRYVRGFFSEDPRLGHAAISHIETVSPTSEIAPAGTRFYAYYFIAGVGTLLPTTAQLELGATITAYAPYEPYTGE